MKQGGVHSAHAAVFDLRELAASGILVIEHGERFFLGGDVAGYQPLEGEIPTRFEEPQRVNAARMAHCCTGFSLPRRPRVGAMDHTCDGARHPLITGRPTRGRSILQSTRTEQP